jgi:hypothetical protein
MKRLVLLFALLALAAPAHAYFELTSTGARAVALGPSSIAIVNDVSAYRWNPAALATLGRSELMVDYSKPYSVDNLNENTLMAGTWRYGTGVAVAWHRLAVTDAYAEDLFCLAVGRTVLSPRGGHHLDAGATFKLARAGFKPFDVPGSGTVDFGSVMHPSIDVAARWRTPWSLDVVWVTRDPFQPRYEFIAGSGGDQLRLKHEVAGALHWNRESTINFGWAQQQQGSSTLSAGMEILFFDVFAIRSGLRNIANAYAAQRSPNDLQFTGGFGVFHKGYYVDAAAETNHDIGASYRVSLRFPLGKGGSR